MLLRVKGTLYYYGAGAVFNWTYQDFYTFRDSDTGLQLATNFAQGLEKYAHTLQ